MAGSSFPPPPQRASRPPRPVRPGLWLFPPHPDTRGGSSCGRCSTSAVAWPAPWMDSSAGACWCRWRLVAWHPCPRHGAFTGPAIDAAWLPSADGCRRDPRNGSPAELDWGPCGERPWCWRGPAAGRPGCGARGPGGVPGYESPPRRSGGPCRQGIPKRMNSQKAGRSLPFAVAALHKSPYDWAALALWRSDLRCASSRFLSSDRPPEASSLNHEQS
jgi:hypothetical protein